MVRLLQKDEWVVYAAFLPALLTSGGIGATAALEWHTQKPWHVPIEHAVCVETDVSQARDCQTARLWAAGE